MTSNVLQQQEQMIIQIQVISLYVHYIDLQLSTEFCVDLYIHILSHNFIKFCHIYNFIVYGNVKDSLGSML